MIVERAMSQLKIFNELLKQGYKVHYYIVLMNSKINNLILDEGQVDFYQMFKECLKNGMDLFIYKTIWDNTQASLIRDQSIEKLFLDKNVK